EVQHLQALMESLQPIIGGGRRTRTFEVIRRLIYSQLPLPLGTLPRSTASQPNRRNGGRKATDDVKTEGRSRAPGWARLWRNRTSKVNQRRPPIRAARRSEERRVGKECRSRW